MSDEATQSVMHRFIEFINTANEALAEELIAPNAVFHVPGRAPLYGPAAWLEVIAMMRGGFPDVQWSVEDIIFEGEKVAVRFTMRGTHQGDFFKVPPSGKTVSVQAINFYRLVDGRIAEEWGQPDLLGVMQQIGAIPV